MSGMKTPPQVSDPIARSQTLTQLREVISVSPSEMMEAEARKTKRMTAAGVGKARRTGARHHRASAWLDLRSGYSAALHRMRESKHNFTSATYFGTASSYF